MPTSSDGPAMTSPVWGTDLVCPVPRRVIRRMIRQAAAKPWKGNQSLTDPRHILDTTAILEPGRATRVIFTLDYDYHGSGWFANSDYDRCFHLSLSHPRPQLLVVRNVPRNVGVGTFAGPDIETPSDDEARAWARVFFSAHAPKAWFEPAVGPGDPYRAPGVVHLRLYIDQRGEPMMPRGEVYDLRPWADGSSPAKITDGRLGADVK